jgi:DnaJ-class molecular chaperone
MKDYYSILGLQPGCTEDEIRKAYRALALKHHPDTNPGDPGAEERFKEISEAYAVLVDPEKRGQYDQWRSMGRRERPARESFRYSQEEILQDLFRDPRVSRVFQDLFREFDRAGVRSDLRFFDQLFFGGRGFLFGGIFVWGPLGSTRFRFVKPHAEQMEGRGRTGAVEQRPGLLKRLGQKLVSLLGGGQKALPEVGSTRQDQAADLSYHLTLPAEEAQRGSWVKIAVDRGGKREVLKVRIPPGTRTGTRLRLRGKGLPRVRTSGDLYLVIHLS